VRRRLITEELELLGEWVGAFMNLSLLLEKVISATTIHCSIAYLMML
jgi:hypothetical protein